MRNRILFLIICYLFITGLSYAGFQDLGAGGRPLGMGHAFVGIADDANAIYYNPAGLINVGRIEFSFMWAPLFWGLTDGSKITDYYGAYAQPLGKKSAIGAGWLGRNLVGPGYSEVMKMLYQENMFYISYALKVTENFAFGASIKIPHHQYAEDEYTKNGINDAQATVGADKTFANGYGKMGFGFDAGLLCNWTKKISVGVVLQDITSTNLALHSSGSDYVPMNFKVGIGYKTPKFLVFEDITTGADVAYRVGGLSNDFKFHAGAETWLVAKTIGARFGFGAGTNNYSDFSAGGSYVLFGIPEIQIDYAWVYPLSGAGITTVGNHRISCVIRL